MYFINFYLKNTFFKTQKALFGFIMVAVLALGALELIIPKTSEAEFLIDKKTSLSDLSISQENTILSSRNSVKSLAVAKKIKMVITAYSSTPGQTDSSPFITASGNMVKDGIVANNLLSFGTKIMIPELYGDKIFTVDDRMNQKKGKYHLDIWFPSHSEAKSFGSTLAYVEVLEN